MTVNFLYRPFHLLDKKSNRWLLIISTGIFVILFMNLYNPFNIDRWYENAKFPLFLILSSFGLFGMLVLAISQLIIREVFKVNSLTLLGVILWFIIELLMLTFTMYFIYGDRSLEGSARLSEILLTLRYTLLIVIIPYGGILLYIYGTQKPVSVPVTTSPGPKMVNIADENGEPQIAIDLDQILFLRSADNYVAVYFLKESKVKKELIRTTLKKLETDLQEVPIRRCHRSFMINIDKIVLVQKNLQGYSLSLRDYHESIPVSKNYKHVISPLLRKGRALSG